MGSTRPSHHVEVTTLRDTKYLTNWELWDLRFSLWRRLSFGMWRRVVWYTVTNVSSCTQKKEASGFSETLVTINQTTRRQSSNYTVNEKYHLLGYNAGAIRRPWKWRRYSYVPPKHRLTLNGLHGVISQKMILFITTAVRTSNPIYFNILHPVVCNYYTSNSEDRQHNK
jgi:hypothetical protein